MSRLLTLGLLSILLAAGCVASPPRAPASASPCRDLDFSMIPPDGVPAHGDATIEFTFRNCQAAPIELTPRSCELLQVSWFRPFAIHDGGAATPLPASCPRLAPIRLAPGEPYVVRGAWNGSLRGVDATCAECLHAFPGFGASVEVAVEGWMASRGVRIQPRPDLCEPLLLLPSAASIRVGETVQIVPSFTACRGPETIDVCDGFVPEVRIEGRWASLFAGPSPYPGSVECPSAKNAIAQGGAFSTAFSWNGTWKPDGPDGRAVAVQPGAYVLMAHVAGWTVNTTVEVRP